MAAKKEDIGKTASDIFELHAEFCKIFSDPKRLRIMWCLQEGERSVGDLAKELDLPLSNVSQGLRMMYDRGAVEYRRDGKMMIYRIANKNFSEGCLKIRAGLLEQLRRKSDIEVP